MVYRYRKYNYHFVLFKVYLSFITFHAIVVKLTAWTWV